MNERSNSQKSSGNDSFFQNENQKQNEAFKKAKMDRLLSKILKDKENRMNQRGGLKMSGADKRAKIC